MLQTAYIYTHGDAVGIVGPSPGPTGNSEYQDLGDGAPGTPYNNVGGNGFFHGVANPGRYNGKQLGGVDLHQALLTNTYQYSHGISVGGYNSVVQVGPSPGAIVSPVKLKPNTVFPPTEILNPSVLSVASALTKEAIEGSIDTLN